MLKKFGKKDLQLENWCKMNMYAIINKNLEIQIGKMLLLFKESTI